MSYIGSLIYADLLHVTAIDSDGDSIYLGTEDGQLLHYVVYKNDVESDKFEFTYLLASRQQLQGSKPVRQILLFQNIQLAVTLHNDLLSFYNLPEFTPVSDIRSIRDVQIIVQDSIVANRVAEDGSTVFTVITKKRIRQVRATRDGIRLLKEVDYTDCLAACQNSGVICCANKLSYDLVDLDQRAKIPLFPISQVSDESTISASPQLLPHVVSVTATEFLVSSGSLDTASAIGMFITLEGEITRGTLMFDQYPLDMMANFPHVIVLLPNSKIEIHDIETQSVVQTLLLTGLEGLCRSSFKIPTVVQQHLRKIIIVQNASEDRDSFALDDLAAARRISTMPSDILLLGKNEVYGLTEPTPLMYIDQMIDTGDVESVVQTLGTPPSSINATHDERMFHETAYVYQRCGLAFLDKLLFDDAVDAFDKGCIDPRLLIGMFPEYISEQEEARIYAGVEVAMRSLGDVDALIRQTLLRTVDDEETLKELSDILRSNVTEVLKRYLISYRKKRGFGSIGTSTSNRRLFAIIDRTLLRILLQLPRDESGGQLLDLITGGVEDSEGVIRLLTEHKRYFLLSQLFQSEAKHRMALEIYRNLASGQYVDEEYSGKGEETIKEYLITYGDGPLLWEYGLWLLNRDISLGIELFEEAMGKQDYGFTVHNILEELRADSQQDVFAAFLEHMVMGGEIQDAALTNELIFLYADRVVAQLLESAIFDCVTASMATYRGLPQRKVRYVDFIVYWRPLSVDANYEEFNRSRCKLIELLQCGSPYNAKGLLAKIKQNGASLLVEIVLLLGRTSRHSESIQILVHDLGDFESAEMYCYHNGMSLASCETSTTLDTTSRSDREELFRMLFLECLNLDDYVTQFAQGSSMLNRWGNYVEVATILDLIPDAWSVELVAVFLSTVLAQLAAARREVQIKKSLYRSRYKRITATVTTNSQAI